jgi:hypothetical protein
LAGVVIPAEDFSAIHRGNFPEAFIAIASETDMGRHKENKIGRSYLDPDFSSQIQRFGFPGD